MALALIRKLLRTPIGNVADEEMPLGVMPTCSVNFWLAAAPMPFDALTVNLKTPSLDFAVSAPDKMPVAAPIFTKRGAPTRAYRAGGKPADCTGNAASSGTLAENQVEAGEVILTAVRTKGITLSTPLCASVAQSWPDAGSVARPFTESSTERLPIDDGVAVLSLKPVIEPVSVPTHTSLFFGSAVIANAALSTASLRTLPGLASANSDTVPSVLATQTVLAAVSTTTDPGPPPTDTGEPSEAPVVSLNLSTVSPWALTTHSVPVPGSTAIPVATFSVPCTSWTGALVG